MELSKNHITLTSSADMKNLCFPLKTLQVNFFSYTRFYMDGTTISLLTDTGWYEFFLDAEVPGCCNVYNLKVGRYLWCELFPEGAVADACNNFKINNGIQFTYREKDYVEVFSYASKKSDNTSLGRFIANADLLEKFNSYFKKKAKNLIDKAVRTKLIIPESMRGYDNVESNFNLSFEERKNFLMQIECETNISKLTKREYECMGSISRGKTSKEIARTLNVSPRTIDSHIENIKEKLGCYRKSELSDLFWDYYGHAEENL